LGYPPADGELEASTAPAEPEPAEPEEDHLAGQLDALSGMAERRTQPLASETDVPASDEPTVETASEVANASDEAAEATESEEAPVEEAPVDSAPVVAERDDAEIDPLTAPIEALTEDSSTVHEPQDEPTPIADEVAAAVPPAAPLQVEEPEPMDESAPSDTGTAARQAPKLARTAQLLIVTAAMFNILVAAINAVAGSPVDASLTPVVLGISLLTLAVWAGAAVVFLHWLSRAYAFVTSTSAVRQRHGANMALAGWFIPIAGLLIGYRVLQDVWSGSDPTTRADSEAGTPKARTIDIWLLGLATSLIFGYAMPLALGDSALWSGLAALGVLVAGMALASTIGTISAWQVGADAAPQPADEVEEGTVSTRVDDLTADAPVEAESELVTSD
jgi:hypothetical protein